MIKAPPYPNEEERLKVLQEMGILDTGTEPRFDALTREAVKLFKVKISSISILDRDREWFKSCMGLDATEGPRDISFCGHALTSESVFVVEDTTKDERFKDNPYVIGAPFIRFYAGVVLRERKSKFPIGVFCIKDNKPRKFEIDDISKLLELAEKAEDELNKK